MENEQVIIISYKDKVPKGYTEIVTTSRSTTWSKGLSPFNIRVPILIQGETVNCIFENIWQFAKVYKEFIDDKGEPTADYYKWALEGFKSNSAQRYPYGKGAIPVYSYDGVYRYSYIEARRSIYIKHYAKALAKTNAFNILKKMYDKGEKLALRDFDGYNHKKLGMSYDEVIDCETRKMGHAFIIGMMLENKI